MHSFHGNSNKNNKIEKKELEEEEVVVLRMVVKNGLFKVLFWMGKRNELNLFIGIGWITNE